MSAIKLRGLSLSEAEEAIVELWTCLEEYGIPSPKVKVSRTDRRVTMELSGFDDSLWTELIDTYLTNWRRGTLQLPSANRGQASDRAQSLEKADAATSSFRSIAEIPLTAITGINRKAKRRYYA